MHRRPHHHDTHSRAAQTKSSTRTRNSLREWRHGTRAPARTRMIKSAPALISLSFALLLVASCRSQNNAPATNNSSANTLVSAIPPFQTREPARYRATGTTTHANHEGQPNVIKHAIAKDGESRRI